jgi:hypothetical protein
MPFSAETLRQKTAIMREAFRAVVGRDGSPWEIQAALGVAWYETAFGTGWTTPGCDRSRNWGAVQSRAPSCCYTTDHHPDGTAYKSYFVCYPSDLEGAKGIVSWIHKNAPVAFQAADGGDLGAFSGLLWAAHYYTGICAPLYSPSSDDCRRYVIRNHAQGLHRLIREIAAANGEPTLPIGNLPPEPGPVEGGASRSGSVAFGLVAAVSIGILALTLRKR